MKAKKPRLPCKNRKSCVVDPDFCTWRHPRKGQCAYYEPEKLNKTGGKNGRRKMRT